MMPVQAAEGWPERLLLYHTRVCHSCVLLSVLGGLGAEKVLKSLTCADPLDQCAVQQLKELDGTNLKSCTKEGLDVFSKGLTDMNAAEEIAQNTYDQESTENEIEKTSKNQDGKYKTKESIGLDKSKMTSLPTRRMLRSSFAQLPSTSRRLRTSALPSQTPTRTGWLALRQKLPDSRSL